MLLLEHKKERLEDKEFAENVSGQTFAQKELLRVFATRKVFTDVSFKQAVLSNCYLRNCTFVRCDFTGAQIGACNFKGAKFSGCLFQYTVWEKTLMDDDFLDKCIPAEENLARDLVRALRVNFSQVGNYQAVNRAASIEVRLTGKHLYNAAYSEKTYYRDKYKGVERLSYAWRHLVWLLLDLTWGNGESLLRVLLTGLASLLVAALILAVQQPGFAFVEAFFTSAYAFWGIPSTAVSATFMTTLTVLRFVLFGLFMAILVKRLSRR
jgi:hypothetical protein